MKNSVLSIAALVMAIPVFLSSCKSEEPVDLKMNLQPGSQYLYTMENRTTMSLSIMGQSMQTNQDMLTECIYDVAAGEGGNKKITVNYDRIAMSMRNAMMNMNFDSRDSSKSDKMMRGMGLLVHKPFSMVVSQKGEIVTINGLSDIINSSVDTSTPEGMIAYKQMAGTFNDTAIKSMMQQSLDLFPDHPVKPGDTWKKTFNMGTPMMSLVIDNDFKLVSVSNGVAHIDVTSKINGHGGIGGEMKDMNMDLKGDQKGNMDVEVATGLVTNSKMKQTMNGEMGSAAMKVPITVSSDIHITGKKK